MHSLWWNYVNELLYAFSWFKILQKTQQFNYFDFVRVFTIYHSIAIDIKSLNVIWTLSLINKCHTTMHHDFEKSKTFWMSSKFDYSRLLFLKIILQSTSSQSNFTIVWKTSFVLHTNQRKRVSFYTFWLVIKTLYTTLCCENFAMISNITKKVSRSIYFQKRFENARKTLLNSLLWKFIFIYERNNIYSLRTNYTQFMSSSFRLFHRQSFHEFSSRQSSFDSQRWYLWHRTR